MKLFKNPVTFIVTLLFLSLFLHDKVEASSFEINRIYGADRDETAVKVSQQGWSTGSSTVVLAVSNNFPDALAGAPLAHKLKAPILLTGKDHIDATVVNELKRLKTTKAIILGGPSIISLNVEKQLSSLGIASERIYGEDRYETSVKIAEKIGGTKAIVVNGSNFADSLAIASFASVNQYPILLTSKQEVNRHVKNIVTKYSSTYIIGGTGVVSDAVARQLPKPYRIAGQDRYETAAKVVQELYPAKMSTSTVATGEGFADALTGSVFAAKKKEPVILVRKSAMPAPVRTVLENKGVTKVNVIGGNQVVQDAAFAKPVPKVDVSAQIVATAKLYIGTPYKWGGTTPAGFDCSGYLTYVFKTKHGIHIPRTTAEIWNYGIKVSSPKVGDVVMFETYKPGPSHAGIYIGNNQFIHSGDRGVEISSLSNSYWKNAYLGSVDIINK
ncbi:cell wall-binding repeat-containing protein [Jeotgalibacillus soli]|uniref:NlpC/P60 domain-containing protein n=1 Tax=Jeotgalibacillus soli TaxID=889306 RepID=A0A0C2W163_9BACL|nr:cell wall-binding repeat-containing protein [Jeotgalibacillus soli]KIL49878.1 hypothetical protein KP78_13460 [Jeotgalibacillus soli]